MSRNKFTRVKTAAKRSKSSTKWLARQLNDPYVKKAKEQGFRSRAAFKLIEINDKFNFLKKNKLVIDLGSAPGGWSQVAVEKVGEGNVIAIDILDMIEIPGVKFIKQDFLAEDAEKIIIDTIKIVLKRNRKCDILLSDMAANSCGDAKTDHIRITDMLEQNLEFANKILATDGSFVGKVLQGGASAELLKKFKQNFSIVKHFKPNSSRKESAENYIIGLGFKGASSANE